MRLTVLLFTLLFGILSLAPNMQGGQFFKISELVEHYEHHQDSGDTFRSFLSFVGDHYFNNHQTSDDEKQMPFKSTVAPVLLLTVHHVELIAVELPEFQETQTILPFIQAHGKISGFNGSVWNPPKMC